MFYKKKDSFYKTCILDVWHGPEYTSGLLKLFCCFSEGYSGLLIYAKLIIVFTTNLEFPHYSEVIHGSTTLKLTKC